ITAVMDASMVYGSDAETAAALRDGAYLILDADSLLLSTDDGGVLAGDVRAAENVALTSLHTLFAREHNRWVDEISQSNPDLTENELFNAARVRVEAEIQAITYNEWLPILVGDGAIADYQGYDPTVNPGISVEFSTAAFRFGHSLLSPEIQRLNSDGSSISAGALALREAFFNPSEIGLNGGIDPILMGLGDGTAQELDTQVVEDVRSFLFAPTGDVGLDLAAINIQRGRDLGVASYNDLREGLGLTRARDFSEITSDADLAAALAEIYGDVDLVDAWVGGLAEDAHRDGLVGELFATIIIDQFTRIRDGDALWSQSGNLPAEETSALWQTTLADIIEANTDVDAIQNQAFYVYDRIGGTQGDDVLAAAGGRTLLLGLGGNDTLNGSLDADQIEGDGGNDIIDGGAGTDELFGGEGDDHFYASTGRDTYDGGEGSDTIDLSSLGGGDSLIDLSSEDALGDGSFLTSIENAIGTWGDNYIDGTSGRNVLQGSLGNDMLSGLDGNDVLRLWKSEGQDRDVLDGGNGVDTADFSGLGMSLWVDLAFSGDSVWTQDALTLVGADWRAIADLENVENIVGTIGIDNLAGDAASNTFSYLGSSEVLGIERIDGRDGLDTADFSSFASGIWADLAYGAEEVWTRDTRDLQSGTWRAIADLDNIENLRGTNGLDILRGDEADNVLSYVGTAQIAGTDHLSGRSGIDTADFSSFTSAVWIDLSYQTDEAWTRDSENLDAGSWRAIANLTLIEALVGTVADDRLIGDDVANTIEGGSGNDRLTGKQGPDTFVFRDRFGDDIVDDFASGNREKIDLSGVADITSFGDLIDNHLVTDQETGSAKIVSEGGTILLLGISTNAFGGRNDLLSDDDFIF
ncbi:MAG: peroxidase family protein, partial [Pseudomonadota bacterium]